MAKFEKANSVGEWLEQRLNIKAINKVMMTEYWRARNFHMERKTYLCFKENC